MSNQKVVIMIPCRMNSTRFPGKPLAKINNEYCISILYELVKQSWYDVWIVTPDRVISDALLVNRKGSKICITSDKPINGTERCFEAARQSVFGFDYEDIIINVQGDMVYFDISVLHDLVNYMNSYEVFCASVFAPVKKSQLGDMNRVKCSIRYESFLNAHVIDQFSRTQIPHQKNFLHVGIYAYTFKTLKKFFKFGVCGPEKKESLEQLRVIENGEFIGAVPTVEQAISIDTEADLNQLNMDIANAKDNTT